MTLRIVIGADSASYTTRNLWTGHQRTRFGVRCLLTEPALGAWDSISKARVNSSATRSVRAGSLSSAMYARISARSAVARTESWYRLMRTFGPSELESVAAALSWLG